MRVKRNIEDVNARCAKLEAAYLLDELDVAKSDGTEYKWDESALRKIHKVSDYSFSELLTSLKNTSKIPSPV